MARGEGIKKLSSLFEKYQKTLIAPQGSVIKVFVEVVDDVLGIKLKNSFVSYQASSKMLVLKRGGALRSEILLHKRELLTHLKGRLGEKSAPKDII